MLFCFAIIKVLTAISAIFMAHEALRTTGVDLFGYVLQTLDIAPSSSKLFHHLVQHSPLEVEDLQSESLIVNPIVLHQEIEETVIITVNTTTMTEEPEPEESVEDPTSHRVFGTTSIPAMC